MNTLALRACLLVGLTGLMVANLVHATQPTPQRALLAISKLEHRLSVIDLATLTIVARYPVGPDPHEIATTADARTAYVSNMIDGGGHEIDVIDLAGQKAQPALDTGPLKGTHGLVFRDGKLWFTAQGAKSVAQLDAATGTVDWVMGTGQDGTHMIQLTPDGHRFYTTNMGSGTVSLFDYQLVPPSSAAYGFVPQGREPTLQWVQTLIPLAPGVEGFDVAPNGAELWTASPATGQLFVIETATRRVSAYAAGLFGANRLRFTLDGKRLFVSSIRSGDVVVFDTATRGELKRLHFCNSTTGIAMDPDGTRAFIACYGDGYLAVIDLASLDVMGRVEVGGRPDGMAFAIRP
jgi:DNA-binding beta-propeller fold protein YncE